MVYALRMIFDAITEKKKRLDRYRPLPPDLVKNLEDWYRVELTYTSNAIEGNTLTRRETALVLEKGLTVGGKSLREHLEAANHAQAIDWVRDQVRRTPADLGERDMLAIHSLILKGIDDINAGRYRNIAVRIAGSTVVLPNPMKVPDLMADFAAWLAGANDLHPVALAAEAHYRLVTIHPFVDGNGRTARLLMNLLLMMAGYPPAIIQKRERLAYIGALEKAQTGGSKSGYESLIYRAVDRSLEMYLKAVEGETLLPSDGGALLKIGALAARAGVANSTIRHWTKLGLLEVAEVAESGYQLYAPEMIERIERIRALQEQRYTLDEIKAMLE
ncbi:MAG: Fic family protein [Candidatus Hydrogenedentes bacterium]|nr:Fic family protein [Candidatus Hydrogenedentota bacterium]